VEDMSETYQPILAVAAGRDAAGALRATLDDLVTRAVAGTLAVGELTPTKAEPPLPPRVELERLQREFALGAVASHWRHTLNNTLAALLAEAQLMQMEPMSADHVQAVERIITLCRRMIVILREGPGVLDAPEP
jgi:signal transduction histidine kinase